jgi:hypothetical protein
LSRVAPGKGSAWLVAGGWLSLGAALLHLAVIVGGPDWYRFFGAGEGMAQADQRGEWTPAIMTLGIAGMLALWGAFAFSGAGRIARLPLLRTGLIAISAIYLLRGLLLVPVLILKPQAVDAFALWSSLIVLVYGLAYAIGTWRAWPQLDPAQQAACRNPSAES